MISQRNCTNLTALATLGNPTHMRIILLLSFHPRMFKAIQPTCLEHLVCIVLPKVAKASTEVQLRHEIMYIFYNNIDNVTEPLRANNFLFVLLSEKFTNNFQMLSERIGMRKK